MHVCVWSVVAITRAFARRYFTAIASALRCLGSGEGGTRTSAPTACSWCVALAPNGSSNSNSSAINACVRCQVLELCTGGTLAQAVDPHSSADTAASGATASLSKLSPLSNSPRQSGGGDISFSQKISWASNCADAVAYLHSRHVVIDRARTCDVLTGAPVALTVPQGLNSPRSQTPKCAFDGRCSAHMQAGLTRIGVL